ncbi:peptidylprolyl isomerase [Candidatus Zixiibacteriota bacterium]
MRKSVLFISVLLGIALLFCGCSKKEDRAVAKVGGEAITAGELDERMQGKIYPSAEEDLAARQNTLGNLIDEKLMIMGAIDLKLDEDPEFATKTKMVERNALLERLYKVEIMDKAIPTEEEIKAHYDRLGWEIKASHILVETEVSAQEVLQKLSEGAAFAKLAEEMSIDPGTKIKGGDLGYFSWGKMVSPFQDTAFVMEIGAISKPVETRFGWHIIRVDDRRELDKPPYEEEKPRIERALGGQKSKQLSKDYIEELKEKADVQIDPETEQMLLNHLLADKWSPGEYTEEELSMTLLTFKDGEWTVETFLAELENIPPMYRPRVKDHKDLEDLLKNVLTGLLLEKRAYKMGLQNDKEIVERVRKERDNVLLTLFREQAVLQDTTVTEQEIETYYNEHIDDYTILEQVKVLEIQLASEEDANKVLSQLRMGADFTKLAQEKSTRSWAAKKGGDLGWLDKRRYPNVSGAALEMRVGELGGPIQDGPRYSVIKVLDKKPAQPKLIADVRPTISNILLTAKKNDALKVWMDNAKAEKGVEIFEDVLQSTVTSVPKETKEPEEES